jgi:hypothetical protein
MQGGRIAGPRIDSAREPLQPTGSNIVPCEIWRDPERREILGTDRRAARNVGVKAI